MQPTSGLVKVVQLAQQPTTWKTVGEVLRHVHRSCLAPLIPRPAVVADACCEDAVCRRWRVTALQGLEAPRGATTWLPCSAHLRALRHRATGHSIGEGAQRMTLKRLGSAIKRRSKPVPWHIFSPLFIAQHQYRDEAKSPLI